MEDHSCQVSDFPTVCRAATRTARSLFGSQVFGWVPGQIETCRHHTPLCWERQPALSSRSLCPEPPIVLGSSERVMKWQAGLGLSACWASGRGASGSLRIAPNHGSGLPVGSAASPCLSHSKAFGDRLCIFPVASMARGWAWDLGAAGS